MMSYRYGFNGKEMDNDFSGGKTGAIYDYGFRVYDSRIAKFLSVDPLKDDYPWYTPYQFAGNMPIAAIDLDGLEEFICIYSPYTTEVWMAKFANPSDRKVQELVEGARSMTMKHYTSDQAKDLMTMYENDDIIHFRRDHSAKGKGRLHQATTWEGKIGNYEKSGAIAIMGYNYSGELVTIYRSPTWGKVMRDWDQKNAKEYQNQYNAYDFQTKFEGKRGWNNGGKQLFFGVIGAHFGIAELYLGAEGIVAVWTWLSLANEADNIAGTIVWGGGDSFTVGLSDNKKVKVVIQGLKTAIDAADLYKDISGIIKEPKVAEKLFNAAAGADDGESINIDIETIQGILKDDK